MIPVWQNQFNYGRGNCVSAAIASIFELALEEVKFEHPPHGQEVIAWTEQKFPELECCFRDLGRNYRLIGSWYSGLKWAYDPVLDWEPPTDDYWMAGVFSRGVKVPFSHNSRLSDYWPMPGLHAVVMKGSELVHDPNPRYEGLVMTPLVTQTWWTKKNTPE